MADETKKTKLPNPRKEADTLNMVGSVANLLGDVLGGKGFGKNLAQPFQIAAANATAEQQKNSLLSTLIADPVLAPIVQEGNNLAEHGGIMGNLNQSIPNVDILAQMTMGGNLAPVQKALTSQALTRPEDIAYKQAQTQNVLSDVGLKQIETAYRPSKLEADIGGTLASTDYTKAQTDKTRVQTSYIPVEQERALREEQRKIQKHVQDMEKGYVSLEQAYSDYELTQEKIRQEQSKPGWKGQQDYIQKLKDQSEVQKNIIRDQENMANAARKEMLKESDNITAANRELMLGDRLQSLLDQGAVGIPATLIDLGGVNAEIMASQLGYDGPLELIRTLRQLTSEKILAFSGAAATDKERQYIESQNVRAWDSPGQFQATLNRMRQQVKLAKIASAGEYWKRGVSIKELGKYGISTQQELDAAMYIKKVMVEDPGMLNGSKEPTANLKGAMQLLNIPFTGKGTK